MYYQNSHFDKNDCPPFHLMKINYKNLMVSCRSSLKSNHGPLLLLFSTYISFRAINTKLVIYGTGTICPLVSLRNGYHQQPIISYQKRIFDDTLVSLHLENYFFYPLKINLCRKTMNFTRAHYFSLDPNGPLRACLGSVHVKEVCKFLLFCETLHLFFISMKRLFHELRKAKQKCHFSAVPFLMRRKCIIQMRFECFSKEELNQLQNKELNQLQNKVHSGRGLI